MLSLCVIVWSLGTAACGLARSFSQLLLATTAIAAGETGLLPIIYSALPDIFPYRQRALANRINYLAGRPGAALGLSFGGAAIGALYSYHSLLPTALRSWEAWRLTFFAVAPSPAPIIVFCNRPIAFFAFALNAFRGLKRRSPWTSGNTFVPSA